VFAGADLVRRDGEGFVHYVGRATTPSRIGGKWLLPPSEDCLLAHGAVDELPSWAYPMATGLTRPVAFVVRQGPALPSRRRCARRSRCRTAAHVWPTLDAYKHPRKVFVVADLPAPTSAKSTVAPSAAWPTAGLTDLPGSGAQAAGAAGRRLRQLWAKATRIWGRGRRRRR